MKNAHIVKKSLVLLLAVTLALILCACSNSAANPGTPTTSAPAPSESSSRVSDTPIASTAPAPTAPPSQAPSNPAVSNTPVVSDAPAASGNTPSSSPMPTVTTTPSTPTATGTPPSGGTAETLTFRVNANMPTYQCVATLATAGYWPTTTRIVITDTSSGALIQTIIPPEENVEYSKSAVYFADVNFDGDLDIVIPLYMGANNWGFDAYLWDSATGQFVEAPSFQAITRAAVDPDTKQMLSSASGSAVSMYYRMYSFENGQFVQTNEFSWDIASDDQNPPPNAGNLMHFTEVRNVPLQAVLDRYSERRQPETLGNKNELVRTETSKSGAQFPCRAESISLADFYLHTTC